jgi:general secretion pathway protein K
MRRFVRNSRGMALVLTILIISLIVALTLQFNTSMRSDLHAAVNLRDGIRLGYIAKSGFNYARAVLRVDDESVDSLHDAWADSKSLSKNSAELFGDSRFDLMISDHSGRIQINKILNDDKKTYNDAQKGLLTRFLRSPEFGIEDEEAENIVNAIKDWIDEDDDPTGFSGAENSYYQTLDKPYSCKNAPVEFLEELLLIRGITEELFYGIKEKPGIALYLSPYGDGKVNINTAGRLVLAAFFEEIDDEIIKDMDDYRMDEKNEESLSNSNWYKSVPGMGDRNINPDLLTTASTYFEITSKGFKEAMSKQVTGMVERKEKEFDIVSWKIE